MLSKRKRFMPSDDMAATLPKPLIFPAEIVHHPKQQGASLGGRFLVWSGFAMAEPDHPRGWQWNPATIVSVLTFLLVIAGLIAGGAWFMGALYMQQQQILQRLDMIEKKADNAIQLSLASDPKPDPTPVAAKEKHK